MSCWTEPPAEPLLAPGAVHVWRAALETVPDAVTELLSAGERRRAERFARPRAGRLWARAHGVLRALLGSYLQTDPRTLVIAQGAHGKPCLAEGTQDRADRTPGAHKPLAGSPAFNLSHSGDVALFAFAAGHQVGVDVECAPRPRDAVALAARVFGAEEMARLQQLEPAAREREFLRAWVRHEARLKCLGTGIGGAPAPEGRGEPWIGDLEMGPEAAAALAVDIPPRALHCWTYPGGWLAERGRARPGAGRAEPGTSPRLEDPDPDRLREGLTAHDRGHDSRDTMFAANHRHQSR